MVYESFEVMTFSSTQAKELIDKHNLKYEMVELKYRVDTTQPGFEDFMNEYIDVYSNDIIDGFVYD